MSRRWARPEQYDEACCVICWLGKSPSGEEVRRPPWNLKIICLLCGKRECRQAEDHRDPCTGWRVERNRRIVRLLRCGLPDEIFRRTG